MSGYTAHLDRFVRDRLPPPEQWPELVRDLPELRYPARLNCVAELLDARVAGGQADRPCLMDQDGVWSYAELQQRVNRIANVLTADFGIVPGNRILLHGTNTPMLVACWLAIVKAGAIAVTTIPLLRARELTHIVDKAQVQLALCEARLRHSLEEVRRRLPVLEDILTFNGGFNAEDPDPLEARKAIQPNDFRAAPTAADDPCLIAFTAGTTGEPKATVHLHRDVLASADTFGTRVLEARQDDLFCGSPSIGFAFGLNSVIVLPMRVGAASVVLPNVTPETQLAAISTYKATICCSTPAVYTAMGDMAARYDLSSLRCCVSGGEPLPEATRTAFKEASGSDIIHGIGATELLGFVVAAQPEAARPGTVGKAVPGYRITVLGDDGSPLAPGAVGRLAVKGPTGCLYLDDPRQAEHVHNGWNLTSNACVIDRDGYVHYQARLDELIVSSSYVIAGHEVEAALNGHPQVRHCAVIGAPDGRRGEIVKAFVVLKDGTIGDEALVAELQGFVKREIAPFKYPRQITFVDALPVTKSGHVQRYKLREMQTERSPAID